MIASPAVESRFLIAHHPTGERAVWVRFVRSGARREAWCTVFSDGQQVSARWPAEFAGVWSAQEASTRFALSIEAKSEPSALIGAPLVGIWPSHRITTPIPNGIVHGEVQSALGQWSLEGWLGCTGHNFGKRWSDDYVWAQTPFSGGWLEVVSSRLHFGPWRSPRLTLAALHLDGVTHRFERLFQPTVHTTPQALTMVARNAAGELFVKVFAPESIVLEQTQSNGKPARVRNCSRADLELRWSPSGAPAQEILVPAGASLEFGEAVRLEKS